MNTIPRNKKIPKSAEAAKKFAPYFLNYETDNQYNSIKDLIAAKDIDVVDETLYLRYYYEKDICTELCITGSQLPYCCGLSELGELSCDKGFPGFSEILDFIAVDNKGHTFIMNTNGKGSSIHFERELAKCKYWTKIKQFKNASGGNTITVWMTNTE